MEPEWKPYARWLCLACDRTAVPTMRSVSLRPTRSARRPGLELGLGLNLGLGLALVSGVLVACQAPDGRALQKLACEHAAANLDMQSVAQMDALRKALGVAPGVDPISTCKALGADMTPRPSAERP